MVDRRSEGEGAFIFGVVLGAVAGAATALFLTPRSGEALRAELLRRGRGLQERVQALAAGVQERSREVVAERAPWVGEQSATPPPSTPAQGEKPPVEPGDPAGEPASAPASTAAAQPAPETGEV